jgi:hypothetical protein
MPARRQQARDAVIPGLYAHLMERLRDEIELGDPRREIDVYQSGTPAEAAEADARSPMIRAAKAELADMLAGEPVLLRSSQIPWRRFPEFGGVDWLANIGRGSVMVTRDDVVMRA